MAELGFAPILSGQIPGVITTVVFAFLSAIAFISVAFRWVWLILKPSSSTYDAEAASRYSLFFHTQLGLYSLCLLASNLFSSVSGLLGIVWVMDKGIQEGSMCTAQAVMMQIGNVATAFFTATIAIHTFNSLVLRNRQTAWMGILVIVAGWLAAATIATAPLLRRHPLGPLYGISAFSCGVRRVYAQQQFLFHLLPIFLAAIVSVILYSLIFLVLRGTLVFNGGFKVNLNPHQRWNGRIGNYKEYHQFMNTIAKSMLWYPFAYILLLLPYTITRMVDLSGFKVSAGGNIFALSCVFSLGLFNVLLLYNILRVIGPVFASSGTRETDMESFISSEKPSKSSMTSNRKAMSPVDHQPIQVPKPSRSAFELPKSPLRHHQPPSITASDSSTNGLDVKGYQYYAGRDQTAVSAASLQRTITPISELNDEFLATPEIALKKGATGTPRLRLQTGHLREGSAESTGSVGSSGSLSSSSSAGLQPAPRYTRSPVARQPTLETLPPSPQIKYGKQHSLSPTTPVSSSSITFGGPTTRDSFGIARIPSNTTMREGPSRVVMTRQNSLARIVSKSTAQQYV